MSLLSCLYFGVFLLRRVAADYESAGCSDEGCGIPCYLKPPGDNCHYAEHNPCGDEGVTDLDLQLAMLNDSLVRLQEKLIQKNISECTSMHRDRYCLYMLFYKSHYSLGYTLMVLEVGEILLSSDSWCGTFTLIH